MKMGFIGLENFLQALSFQKLFIYPYNYLSAKNFIILIFIINSLRYNQQTECPFLAQKDQYLNYLQNCNFWKKCVL